MQKRFVDGDVRLLADGHRQQRPREAVEETLNGRRVPVTLLVLVDPVLNVAHAIAHPGIGQSVAFGQNLDRDARTLSGIYPL